MSPRAFLECSMESWAGPEKSPAGVFVDTSAAVCVNAWMQVVAGICVDTWRIS